MRSTILFAALMISIWLWSYAQSGQISTPPQRLQDRDTTYLSDVAYSNNDSDVAPSRDYPSYVMVDGIAYTFAGCAPTEASVFGYFNSWTDHYTYETHTHTVPDPPYKGDIDLSAVEYVSDGNTRRKVTSIYQDAFLLTEITSITFPKTVTRIQDGAFYRCPLLNFISIPTHITEIGSGALGYIENIIIEDSDTPINAGSGKLSTDAYWNKATLKLHYGRNIIFPTTYVSNPFGKKIRELSFGPCVTVIPGYCFINCTYLGDFDFPDGLTTIGDAAFNNCGFTKLHIPASVTSIGVNAFANCKNLQSITVDQDNQNYCSLDGALFDKELTTLIQYPAQKKDKSFTLPASVRTIEAAAFRYNPYIENIVLNEGLNEIKEYAFEQCTNLKSIEIPNTVTELAESTFTGCESLQYVKLGSSVSDIRQRTFENCTSLTTVAASPGAKYRTIAKYAFANCKNLRSIDLNSVEVFIDYAFEECENLPYAVLSNKSYYLGFGIFSKCPNFDVMVDLAQKPQELNSPFFRNERIPTVYVPHGCLEAYYYGINWVPITDIRELSEGFNLILTQENLNINIDETKTIAAIAISDNQEVFPEKIWYSENSDIVSVDDEGNITGVSEGSTRVSVTVKDNNYQPHTKYCAITVVDGAGIPGVVAKDTSTIDYSLPYNVYDLSGLLISSDITILPPGTYIVRQGPKVRKLLKK